MKKYFLIFVPILLSSFVFAQNEGENNVTTDTKILNDQLNMWLVHNNQINKVSLKFCNNGFGTNQLSSSLDLIMKPNQKKDICIALVNQSSTPLRIVANIVPGSLNANGNIVCSNVAGLTWDFTVSDFEELSGVVDLWAQQQLIKHFRLSASDVASGKYITCLAINLETSEKLSASSPFNLVIRKAGNIKVSVMWEPYRFQWFDDIMLLVKKNTRTIAKIGIIVCGILLVYSLIPMIRSKKKSSIKKPNHKK